MVRKNNAPQHLSLLKKIVRTLVRNNTTDTTGQTAPEAQAGRTG